MTATSTKSVGTEKRHRLQFEFSPEAYDRLESIKQKAGVATFAELVRNALRVYEWVLEQRKAGYEIGVLRNGEPVKTVELLL